MVHCPDLPLPLLWWQTCFETDHVLISHLEEDDILGGEESSSNIDFLLFDFQTQPCMGGEVSHPDPSCASKSRVIELQQQRNSCNLFQSLLFCDSTMVGEQLEQ